MKKALFFTATLLALLAARCETAFADQAMDDARKRWAESPYGPMLERILPPGFEAAQLPAPDSHGARLTMRYCVQCHNLPSPAMHHAGKWPGIVDRMVLRMRGRGNMGKLMSEMMAGVTAPAESEARTLVAYLKRNAQKRLDPKAYPELAQPSGEAFRIACRQCHTLPDPKRHSASEWPAVVARMQRNMEWMNRVVGTRPVRGEPQLRVEEINAFLAKHAKQTR